MISEEHPQILAAILLSIVSMPKRIDVVNLRTVIKVDWMEFDFHSMYTLYLAEMTGLCSLLLNEFKNI